MEKKHFFLTLITFLISYNLCFAQNVDSSNFSEEYTKFTNKQKQFNDWSISLYGGVPFLQSADFTSIENGASGKWRFGYDVQLSLNKQISHVFAINLLGQMGETKQGYGDDLVKAKTKYSAISLIGDLNVSSLFRRIDNRSAYRWAIHAYAGVGTIQYKAYTMLVEKGETSYTKSADVDMGGSSFFGQAGGGVTYKINNRWDAGFKAMYVITGDELFDGSGNTGHYADLHPGSKSDNFFTTSLGLTYKLGRHKEHLGWVDPLREIFTKINSNMEAPQLEVCIFGDRDDDGVCDDWDRELDTPKGARVDGSGRALDVDMDGVIDLYDKCPTFPGPASNDGCPEAKDVPETLNLVVKTMGGIQFNFDSDKILIESQTALDNVAEIIKTYGKDTKFYVEGHTDARGSEQYNLNLSKKRVMSVIKYLVSKGVAPYQLIPKGMGASQLKYQECNPASKCPEWKNRENRRVIFRLAE